METVLTRWKTFSPRWKPRKEYKLKKKQQILYMTHRTFIQDIDLYMRTQMPYIVLDWSRIYEREVWGGGLRWLLHTFFVFINFQNFFLGFHLGKKSFHLGENVSTWVKTFSHEWKLARCRKLRSRSLGRMMTLFQHDGRGWGKVTQNPTLSPCRVSRKFCP